MPRGVAVLWAGLALGWSWSFTVCQPGLGIAPQLKLGGLGNEQAGKRKTRRRKRRKKARKKERERREKKGGIGKRASTTAQSSAVYWASGNEYKTQGEIVEEGKF